MFRYKVSYRIVPNTEPALSMVMEYITESSRPSLAIEQTWTMVLSDVASVIGVADVAMITRTTVRRVRNG